MPTNKQQASGAPPETITEGIFAGLTPERAEEIKAHFTETLAEERKTVEALLEQATAATAQPAAPPSVKEITPENIVAALASMRDAVGGCLSVLQKEGRAAGRKGDHVSVAKYGRLATVFGEFSNAIAEFLASHPSLTNGN